MADHTASDVVVVTGTGIARAAADVVSLSLALRAGARDVSAALSGVTATMDAVTAAAREAGLRDRDIASIGAGVQPQYDREGMRVVGYQAYHQLSLVVRDVTAVGAVVAACASAAGNALSVDAITLEIADRRPLEQGALDAAFAHARAKAEQLATLSGRTLGAVRTVLEGTTAGMPMPPVAYAAKGRLGAADMAMSVEAGEHSVTATVTVTWSLD